MSGEQLENWIMQREREDEIRSRIVPASADRLTAINPGDGEAAMDSVAAWLGDHPELPIVEIGRISPRAVTLTFSEEVLLPDPWVSALGDNHNAHDQWGIELSNALALARSEQYGWQVSGLTGIGTLIDGSRGLVNTCRWEILQIAGSPEWTQNLILTQVMNQAAEPWSAEHDLWLVGFGESAEKLMNFLANEHPAHRFHVVESIKDLDAEDLQGAAATIYVMGADRDTELQFQALQTTHIGLVADTIITDQAMFLTEREGGQAVLGPFRHNLEIWPNISAGLIEKMEQAWVATEEIAKQKAAETDFDAFLTQHEEENKEDQHSETGLLDEILSQGPPGGSSVRSEGHPEESDAMESPEDTKGQVSDVEATGGESTWNASLKQPDTPDDPAEAQENDLGIVLKVLGESTVTTAKGDLTGRHAALLVILHTAQEPVAPQAISEALWPGDEATGHNARTRRSRLRAKVHQHIGEIIQMQDDGWFIEKGALTSDLESVVSTLCNEPINNSGELIQACRQVATPLEGQGSWVEPYRTNMIEELVKALTSLKDRAVEAEEYDTAKEAKSALVQLGRA